MTTERTKAEGFTPGPWGIRYEYNVFSGNRLIANAGSYSNNWDSESVERENVANARLIAASPDLYAACKAMADANDLTDVTTAGDAARAALAKANGGAE